MNGYRKSLIRHCEARAASSGNDPRTVRACRGNPGAALDRRGPPMNPSECVRLAPRMPRNDVAWPPTSLTRTLLWERACAQRR